MVKMDQEEISVRIDDDVATSARQIAESDRQAAKYRGEAAKYRRETAALNIEAEKRAVDANWLTTKSELSAAEAALKEADELGDSDAKVAATRRIAAGEARRAMLENNAAALQRTPISSGDQFEDHLARFTEPTARWMREHRDWVEDPRRNAKLTGAHHLALSEGLEPDTDRYFEFVEKTIGVRSGNGSGRHNVQRTASKSYDPADHRTHVTDDGVYLTSNERKIATDGTLVWNHGPNRGKPLGLQEMARRKSELAKQGAYNRLG